jgi:hypothetical protein
MDIVIYGWETGLPSLSAVPELDTPLAPAETTTADDRTLFDTLAVA